MVLRFAAFNAFVCIFQLTFLHSNQISFNFKLKHSIFTAQNKIKFLYGEAFQGLDSLREVGLDANECISDYFFEPTKFAGLKQKVNEKCGNNEFKLNSVMIVVIVCAVGTCLFFVFHIYHNYCRIVTSSKVIMVTSAATPAPTPSKFKRTNETEEIEFDLKEIPAQLPKVALKRGSWYRK
jgi:hypothetical protein